MSLSQPRKIIVGVAPVGHDAQSPSANPVTPEEVAAEVIACSQAGAAMVHLHVRDRRGRQTADLESSPDVRQQTA